MVMIETAAYDIFVTLYTLCEKAAVSAGALADRGYSPKLVALMDNLEAELQRGEKDSSVPLRPPGAAAGACEQ